MTTFTFWRHQIEEHMTFLYHGLTDTALKQEAYQFYLKWQNVNVDNVIPLIDNTFAYQNKLQLNLLNGKWVGWLSFSFIQHLNDELLYFKDKLSGHMTKTREVTFWLHHHETEMKGAEKLIDPLEQQLCQKIKKYIDNIKRLKNKNLTQFTIDYLNLNDALKDKMLTSKVLTNISPTLIDHVIREGEYCLDQLQ